MIELVNVKKSYNKVDVLKGISLNFPSTGLITILGESGCGKSTLLNLIGGLDFPSSGSITYDGSIVTDLDEYRKNNISYIFQDGFLLKQETVFNNLYRYLMEIGIYDYSEAVFRINKALKLVKLERYKKHLVKNLSGGEAQRVGIARAILRNNRIILADEPTGNLDIDNARLIMEALVSLSKNSLVILVTHNKELANLYSDKIYKINNGLISNEYEPDKREVIDENKIYEDELKKVSIEDKNIKLNIFDMDSLDISFYSINGKVYYKSNRKINNIEESPYKVYEKRIEDKNKRKEVIEPIIYDDTKIYGKRNVLKEVNWYLFDKTKVSLLHHIFLVLVGILFFFLAYFMTSATTVDSNAVRYTDNAYLVNKNIHNDGRGRYIDNVRMAEYLAEGKIHDIVEEKVLDFYLFNTLYIKGKKVKALYLPLEYNDKELLCGVDHIDNKNDVLVSKAFADSLKNGISYEALLGYHISINGNDNKYNIIGVTNSNNYEVFYLKTNDIITGNRQFSFLGENKLVNVVKTFNDFSIPLKEGALPSNKREILALDNGKIKIGDKAGDYIVSGLYELDDSIEKKYEYVLSFDSINFKQDKNIINNKIFGSSSTKTLNYLFMMDEENSFLNVSKEKNYQESVFFGSMHDKLVGFVIPSVGILVLVLGYLVIMSNIMINKRLLSITFERIVGKKKFSVVSKVFITSLLESTIFIFIPYIITSILFLFVIYTNTYFNLGLLLLSPYARIWVYSIFILVLLYCLLFSLITMIKIKKTPANLMKSI